MPSAGSITLAGQALAGQPSCRIGPAGVGLVPEGRQVFPNLTVHENLVATASTRNAAATPWTLARVKRCSRGWPGRATATRCGATVRRCSAA